MSTNSTSAENTPINDETRERNGNLPGMGGVFNAINLHAFNPAGNNPIRYVDPDGFTTNIRRDTDRYWGAISPGRHNKFFTERWADAWKSRRR